MATKWTEDTRLINEVGECSISGRERIVIFGSRTASKKEYDNCYSANYPTQSASDYRFVVPSEAWVRFLLGGHHVQP